MTLFTLFNVKTVKKIAVNTSPFQRKKSWLTPVELFNVEIHLYFLINCYTNKLFRNNMIRKIYIINN